MKRWLCAKAYRLGIISWFSVDAATGQVVQIGLRGNRTWCREHGWMRRLT